MKKNIYIFRIFGPSGPKLIEIEARNIFRARVKLRRILEKNFRDVPVMIDKVS